VNILLVTRLRLGVGTMKLNVSTRWLQIAPALCFTWMLTSAAVPAIKNMALVVSAGSKLSDVPLADLTKYCKGTPKAWPDGKSFTLVMKDPESPDMRVVVQKLFGASPADVKSSLPKLNETRVIVKIVASDEDLIRTVEATPGAVGIIDVYSINSSVKVLRVDGKLPFDVGYALKGS
jgi:hypothetical protein